ncbi:MAG: S41 family peptidase, partial [Candidatus Saccharimonadales bacterium]
MVRKRRRWPNRAAQVLAVAAIFVLGINVGNGNIALHHPHSLNGKLPKELNYTTVNQVYSSLVANYDGKLTENQLIDGLKHGLAQSTNDPYTEYFTPAEAKQFNDELNQSFSGIGAELGQKSGNLQVIAPIAGTPAAKAGLKAGDLIAAINGKPTAGMNVDEAVNKIRGKAGTKVTLRVIRGGQQLNITIVRQKI